MNRFQSGLNSRRVCLWVTTAALLCAVIPTVVAQTPANRRYDILIAGEGDDLGTSVALGEAGDVYVTGNVALDTFPPTAGAYRDANPGLFVSRFLPDGTLGFTAALRGLRGEAIAIDGSGNVYVEIGRADV